MVNQVVLLTIAVGVCFVSTSAYVLPTSVENSHHEKSALHVIAQRVQDSAYYTRECTGDKGEKCVLHRYKDLKSLGCKGGKVYYHGKDVCMCLDDKKTVCIDKKQVLAYHKSEI